MLTLPNGERYRAGGGLGGKNYQTQNPPLGQNPLGRGQRPRPSGARNVGQVFKVAELPTPSRKQVLMPAGKYSQNLNVPGPETNLAGETT